MKFLGSIETFSSCEGGVEVYIPTYHRASLGLFENTKVFAYPQWKKVNGRDIKEIIISPFQPSTWASIWKLELTMPDSPGLIYLITGVLFKRNVNINIEESIISNSSTEFNVFLIADFEHFDFGENLPDNNDKVSAAKKIIQDDLNLLEKSIEIVYLSRIDFLSKKLINDDKEILNKQSVIEYRSDELKPISVKSNCLTITKSLFADLKLIDDDGDILDNIQCSVLSDSEDKYLIIRIIEATEQMAFIDISHSNKLGAINRFSSIIYNISADRPLNLINCYNRIKDINTTCHWYALIDVTANPEILESLFEQLSKIPELDNVKLKVIDYSIGLRKLKLPHLRPPVRSETGIRRNRNYQSEYIKKLEDDLKDEKTQILYLYDEKVKIQKKLRLYKYSLLLLALPSIIFIIVILLLNYINSDNLGKQIYERTISSFVWLVTVASSIFGIILFIESRRKSPPQINNISE